LGGHSVEATRVERWEHFEHQADIGVRGYGASATAAFEQAALALTAVIADLVRVRDAERVAVQCSAPDLELLFTDWLNALVYEMATRRMLFARFRVAIEPGPGSGFRLRGEAWGEPLDPPRHEPAVEVKGATLTALEVAQAPDGVWHAQCVVDV
jgi:SHS2 domain-containing protein